MYEFVWIRRTCGYIYLKSHHCVLYSSKIRVKIRFSVWLISGYAHVFVRLSFVTLPCERHKAPCSDSRHITEPYK